MNAATLNGILDHVGYVIALVIFQLYNMWKHQQNAQRITVNRDLVETGYAALHKDFEDAKAAIAAGQAAIERMAIVINGGDRRAAVTVLSPDDAAAAQAKGFAGGQRWTDPRMPRPEGV